MDYDLLLCNGHVIDPANKRNGRFHIGIRTGKIQKVWEANDSLPLPTAERVIDAKEFIVTPGLIDLHVHVFTDNTPLGIQTDRIGVQQGVTTVVDAGSAGVETYPTFLEKAVTNSETEVLAWINISRLGLCGGLSELADLSQLAPEETARLIKSDSRICGIKARMSASVVKENGSKPLHVAKKVARELEVPVMVHIGNAPPALHEVLELLEAGDVVTHAFHGKKGGIFTEEGSLLPEAERAVKRGVIFDVGHGTSSFSFATMRRALQVGLKPYTISTDIYRHNIDGPVHSLAMTMSKLLALGVSLDEVIEMSTLNPAKILQKEQEIGTLTEGTRADISLLRVKKESLQLTDSEEATLTTSSYLQPELTIKSGKVLKCI
ncbi:amidohydrolase/deacetylase family metallohydrolase [Brevibacillus laterosporus]|uniref:Amidohydrolase/deacetylase family metallohydrolase n=1 Tax=Brevibacillus laterosporus TaxID=1465 RepID=A0AAP8U7A1_BRELA|nr:amidohydrolase/deacetylase family metallohydrolase [Brevibacillus laterosporus]MED1789530.1 amidohydrolase/deacetylase family metallohydrolase [Brevibacillus laterosporus]PPB13171.1 amidohydrolase/deacetylase family metallohydrolase [Brevibacillus laterosporus]